MISAVVKANKNNNKQKKYKKYLQNLKYKVHVFFIWFLVGILSTLILAVKNRRSGVVFG